MIYTGSHLLKEKVDLAFDEEIADINRTHRKEREDLVAGFHHGILFTFHRRSRVLWLL